MYTTIAPETLAESKPDTGKVVYPQLPQGYLKVTGFANRALKRMQVLRKRFRIQQSVCPQCELLFITRTVDRCQCKVQKHG